jgi:hypothetical protein
MDYSKTSRFFLYFLLLLYSTNGLLAKYPRTHLHRQGLSMVSVGGGGGAGGNISPQRPAFIISQSDSKSMDEMMILDNFNQIQLGGSRKLGVIGSQDINEKHKQMIELLAYALVLSGNHIYTSGGGSTNSAVIKGALRACNSDLLTVILPQSLFKQPPEMQNLLMRVVNLVEQPQNDDLDLNQAAVLCNDKILNSVDEALVFSYHDSKTIMKSIASVLSKIEITTFFLD